MRASLTALIVEDHAGLAQTLSDVVRERAARVEWAPTVSRALEWLETEVPDLVLLDFMLPDGTGLDVLPRLALSSPLPVIIAISGEARPEDTFLLARGGVRSFLQKPCGLADVRRAIDDALAAPSDPFPEVRRAVGQRPIKILEIEMRRAMVSEALAKSHGSLSKAASLLGISRQLLQHILKSPDHEGKIERH